MLGFERLPSGESLLFSYEPTKNSLRRIALISTSLYQLIPGSTSKFAVWYEMDTDSALETRYYLATPDHARRELAPFHWAGRGRDHPVRTILRVFPERKRLLVHTPSDAGKPYSLWDTETLNTVASASLQDSDRPWYSWLPFLRPERTPFLASDAFGADRNHFIVAAYGDRSDDYRLFLFSLEPFSQVGTQSVAYRVFHFTPGPNQDELVLVGSVLPPGLVITKASLASGALPGKPGLRLEPLVNPGVFPVRTVADVQVASGLLFWLHEGREAGVSVTRFAEAQPTDTTLENAVFNLPITPVTKLWGFSVNGGGTQMVTWDGGRSFILWEVSPQPALKKVREVHLNNLAAH